MKIQKLSNQSRNIKKNKLIYRSKTAITKLKIKVTSLISIVRDLKNIISSSALEHLEKNVDDIPKLLMNRYLQNARRATITKEAYPEKLKEFACTLQFYSNKAYEYVRRTYAMALPHPATIRRWTTNVDCTPGFCGPAFDALKIIYDKYKQDNRQLICSLMLDEMSIKIQIDFDGVKSYGHIDVGIPQDNDELSAAKEALVLMVVAHNSSWKIPIAYFFIKSLTGKEKANIINEAIYRLHEINVNITSITSDGPSVNFQMFKELGCDLSDLENPKTHFTHPSDINKKIYCIMDVCHMIKLVRNNFAQLKVLKNRQNEEIKWNFIQNLYDLQKEVGLKFGNKLGKSHMEWTRQKMKVLII